MNQRQACNSSCSPRWRACRWRPSPTTSWAWSATWPRARRSPGLAAVAARPRRRMAIPVVALSVWWSLRRCTSACHHDVEPARLTLAPLPRPDGPHRRRVRHSSASMVRTRVVRMKSGFKEPASHAALKAIRITEHSGLLLALALGAIAFSGKAIVVKLAYRYGVDAVTLHHVPHAVCAAAVRASMAWWGSAGQAAVDAARLAGRGGPGLLRLLPGQHARLHGAAVHQRQPGAADPVPQRRRRCCCWAGRCAAAPSPPARLLATAVSYAGVAAGVRARAARGARRGHGLGGAAGAAVHAVVRGLPGLQRRDGAAPGRAAAGGAGHRWWPAYAASPSSCCCTRWKRRRVAAPVVWLSLLNATVHGGAGAAW
jgi:hypothetical protein